jgi:hypothetical protein
MKKKLTFNSLICGLAVVSLQPLSASPVSVTYDDGTIFEVGETGFKNKLNIGIKTGYTYQKLNVRDGEDPDTSSFDVGLARLDLKGESSNSTVGYNLQGDWAKAGLDASNDVVLSSAYVWWAPSDWLKFKLGQMKQGFPFQFMKDDFEAQFYVRDSIAVQHYSIGRNQGLVLGLVEPEKTFGVHFGVFNGESSFSFAEGTVGEGQNKPGIDTDHRFVLTGFYNIMGNVDAYSEGDWACSEDMHWRVNAAYSMADNNVEGGSLDLVDVAAGTEFRYGGFSASAEVLWRDWDLGESSDDGFGYYVQAGHFFMPQELQGYARFSGLDCKAISVSGSNYCSLSAGDDVFEYAGGIAYYLGSRLYKIGAEVAFLDFGDEGSAKDHQRVSLYLSTKF